MLIMSKKNYALEVAKITGLIEKNFKYDYNLVHLDSKLEASNFVNGLIKLGFSTMVQGDTVLVYKICFSHARRLRMLNLYSVAKVNNKITAKRFEEITYPKKSNEIFDESHAIIFNPERFI